MEIRVTEGTDIKKLIAGLLRRAQLRFPKLTITAEIGSLPNDLVCRIHHRNAIDGVISWVAIIPLVTRWKSSHGDNLIVVDTEEILTTRYSLEVVQAVTVGLIEPEEVFAIAE
jgi:hypothetical protein